MTNIYQAEGPVPPRCARLERELAAFLDGTLDDAGSAWVAEHLEACARCSALLDALETPSEVGRALAGRPPMVAPERVWAGVSERIAAPVVSIGEARGLVAVRRSGGAGRWWRMAAAAAVLVAATAGVTRELTLRSAAAGSTAGGVTVAQGAAGAARTPGAEPGATAVANARPSTAPPTSEPPTSEPPTAGAGEPTGAPAGTVTNVANRGSRSAAGARRTVLPDEAARDTYDREIGKLRGILAERRGDLDTSTVRVLEQSMTVIDQAIAQSKRALARDPASRFLNKQLNNALDQKLELLRTAALLPART